MATERIGWQDIACLSLITIGSAAFIFGVFWMIDVASVGACAAATGEPKQCFDVIRSTPGAMKMVYGASGEITDD